MPEVVIKYKKRMTLQVLQDFAKYFDFTVVQSDNEPVELLNGVTIIPGDRSIDTAGLKKIFTGKNIVSKELRSSAWQRKK